MNFISKHYVTKKKPAELYVERPGKCIYNHS
jgi:hypothetical protein